MTDEPNPPFKKGKSKNVKDANILTLCRGDDSPPFKKGKGKPPTYLPIYDAGRRILQALANGHSTRWIIEHVREPDAPRLQKQNIFYWKEKGLELGILTERRRGGTDRRVKFYGKGPNYDLLNQRGWQYRDFLPFVCRVHSPGSAIHVTIADWRVEGDHIALTNLGVTEWFELKSHGGYPPYEDTSFRMLIPFQVIGYRDAYARIYIRFNVNASDYLSISPPEVRLTLDQLSGKVGWFNSNPDALKYGQFSPGHEDGPYRNIVEYILAVFRANEWEFDNWKNNQRFEYAFAYTEVNKVYKGIWNQVPHYSGKFPEEKDLTIWIDHSHGKYEVETSSKWVAIELMTVLELLRKRSTGERKFPKGWGESKFKEVDQ